MFSWFVDQLKFLILIIYFFFLPSSKKLQLLNCEDLLFFSVLCDSKLNIVGFWTVGGTKQAISEDASVGFKTFWGAFLTVVIVD